MPIIYSSSWVYTLTGAQEFNTSEKAEEICVTVTEKKDLTLFF